MDSASCISRPMCSSHSETGLPHMEKQGASVFPALESGSETLDVWSDLPSSLALEEWGGNSSSHPFTGLLLVFTLSC